MPNDKRFNPNKAFDKESYLGHMDRTQFKPKSKGMGGISAPRSKLVSSPTKPEVFNKPIKKLAIKEPRRGKASF
jgi:hypothetical protein